MTSRERVQQTLSFQKTDRIPRDLWTTAAVPMFRAADLDTVVRRFPPDIAVPTDPFGASVSTHNPSSLNSGETVQRFSYGATDLVRGTPYRKGSYVDEWGVTWHVGEDGVKGEVREPLIDDWRKLVSFQVPWRVLNEASWDIVNDVCAATDRFLITPWHINLFERMQFLRGTQSLLVDLAYGASELLALRDIIHEFNLAEIDLWCSTDIDGIRFCDDWGSQTSLLISPDMWRDVFKPAYAEYCHRIHAAGKYVFMHSDGFITPIVRDLVEIGVDALNSQLFCMDMEALGSQFAGRLTFWGELDRQSVLPYGAPADVRKAVDQVRSAIKRPDVSGGIIAQLEWGNDVPMENVIAAFEAWLMPA